MLKAQSLESLNCKKALTIMEEGGGYGGGSRLIPALILKAK